MAADHKTRDTVTSLLNYDVSDNDDDPFREIDTTIHEPSNKPNATKRKALESDDKENADILGLDEEVKITKKRKPVVKLDEAKLLSQPGIPKLRALVRSRSIASKLRLKGKGHEYSDAAKLLSYYQLWLDNLYPRAKFADGLQLVEKVGHSKRMQIMRREWIDEGKPGYGKDVVDRQEAGESDDRHSEERVVGNDGKQPNGEGVAADATKTSQDPAFGSLDEGDDDDLFFADNRGTAKADDLKEPDEDELDALLAEQRSDSNHKQADQNQSIFEEDEGDEAEDVDALLVERAANLAQLPGPDQNQPIFEEDEGDEGDEAEYIDALLVERAANLAQIIWP